MSLSEPAKQKHNWWVKVGPALFSYWYSVPCSICIQLTQPAQYLSIRSFTRTMHRVHDLLCFVLFCYWSILLNSLGFSNASETIYWILVNRIFRILPMVVVTTKTCHTVYPKKYAHVFVVLCFVVVMQSFIMNSHEVFIHIHQGCFAGTGAIVRLPRCQWSKPDGYGKISQCITTTKHSKAKTVCIFLGIYCKPSSRLKKSWQFKQRYFASIIDKFLLASG